MLGNTEKKIEEILLSTEYKAVEIHSAKTRNNLSIRVVIFKKGGIGLGDCEKVHKLLIQQLFTDTNTGDKDNDNISFEITSPGINRVFKSDSEFAIFKGSLVQVLIRETQVWLKGIIEDSDNESVLLKSSTGEEKVRFSDIQKTKLDFAVRDN